MCFKSRTYWKPVRNFSQSPSILCAYRTELVAGILWDCLSFSKTKLLHHDSDITFVFCFASSVWLNDRIEAVGCVFGNLAQWGSQVYFKMDKWHHLIFRSGTFFSFFRLLQEPVFVLFSSDSGCGEYLGNVHSSYCHTYIWFFIIRYLLHKCRHIYAYKNIWVNLTYYTYSLNPQHVTHAAFSRHEQMLHYKPC